MLGVDDVPARTPAPTARCGRWPSGWASATRFHPTPVGVFFGQPGAPVPDPYFGGAGPDAHRLPALRQLHDRLPARRQEHAGQELPVPGRAGRRQVLPADHGHRGAARPPARLRRSRPSAPAPGCARGRRTFEADQVIFAAGALGTQRLLHRMRETGAAARAVAPARRADPDQLRGDPRRLGAQPGRPPARTRLHRRAWRSPARSTPTPVPTSSRSATAGAPTRWACCRPCSPTAARAGRCAGWPRWSGTRS